MSKISTSPDRHTFTLNNYIKRQSEEGKTQDNDETTRVMIEYFEKNKIDDEARITDLEYCKNNLEYDLRSTEWICEKARASNDYAQNLYAAMCNNDFQKLEVFEVLKEKTWSCSWRYAGGIIAHMQEKGDYIDWYCSGIKNDILDYNGPQDPTKHYVPEGFVTDEIKTDLQKLGWVLAPGGDWEKFE